VRITRDTANPDSPRRTFAGHGVNLDIIVAAARAYLNAVNKMLQAPEESALTRADLRIGATQA
jgi:hypothetical protein